MLRGAGGRLSSARATVRLQDEPIGIAIDQLPDLGEPAASGWYSSLGAAARGQGQEQSRLGP